MDCRQGVLRNNVSTGNDKNRRSQSSKYVEDLAIADIRSMNVDQQEVNKATRYLGKPLTGPQVKCGPVTPSYCGGLVSSGKLKNQVYIVKNHTVLDNRINMEDESKIPVENRKHTLADFYK